MRRDQLEVYIIRCQHGDTIPLLAIWNDVQAVVVNTITGFLNGQYSLGGASFDDLHQESYFTMLKAIRAYKPGTNFYGLLKTALVNDFILITGCCTYQLPKALNRATSLDTPIFEEENSNTLAGIIPDDHDDIEDILHTIWLDDLRNALEKALAHINAEQAAALRRRYGGAQLSKYERSLADNGLASLRRKQSTYRYLQRFICDLE